MFILSTPQIVICMTIHLHTYHAYIFIFIHFLCLFNPKHIGVTITACPLSNDYSSHHNVEVFSAGWHQKSIFQRHEASPSLSVEFIPDIYDFNDYKLTWLELSRRPPIAEGIGKIVDPHSFFKIIHQKYFFLIQQRIVFTHVQNWMHVSMHQYGAMVKFIARPAMMNHLFIVRGYYVCRQKY